MNHPLHVSFTFGPVTRWLCIFDTVVASEPWADNARSNYIASYSLNSSAIATRVPKIMYNDNKIMNSEDYMSAKKRNRLRTWVYVSLLSTKRNAYPPHLGIIRTLQPQQLFCSLKVSHTKVPLVSILVRGPSCASRGSVLNLGSLCSRGISSLWNGEMDGNGHCSSGQSYCRCVGKGLLFALSHESGMTVSVFPLPLTQSVSLCLSCLPL